MNSENQTTDNVRVAPLPLPIPAEQWRQIPGFSNYEASSLGRIRNAKTGQIRAISPGTNPARHYPRVVLRNNAGVTKTVEVHRLVFTAFYGAIAPGLEINHRDSNKLNNHVDNLEAVTHLQNVRVSRNVKLNESAAKLIRLAGQNGASLQEIADAFNVTTAAVSDVLRNKNWRDCLPISN